MTRLLLLWLALVLATGLSWLLGADATDLDSQAVGSAVIVVAFVKFRLVGLHFMHLRTAPALLRGLFEGYVVVVASTLVSLLLLVS
jgi:hypothetical protein